MNRQRLLWVILSLTLLVMVILAGGLWLLRTQSTVPVSEINREPLSQFDAFEITNGNAVLPGIQTHDQEFAKQDFAVGEREGTSPTPTPQTEAVATPKQPVQPSPTPLRKPVKQVSATTTKTTEKSTRASSLLFWIQTGSYKSKTKAEANNAVLVENGLSGRIITKEFNKNLYFRVRVGPYTNKREAEKFLTWIKKIDGMEASYISVEYSLKK